jgi:cytoskeletal protein RodZ
MIMLMKKQQGFSVVEPLLILVIVGLIGFIGWFIYNANNKTSKTLAGAAKVSSTTPKQIAKKDAGQTDESSQTSEATTPTDEEKQQIQAAAAKYLNKSTPSFSADEKTLISQNRQFAIQYYCGGYECSALWLKQANGEWTGLEAGIDTQSNIDHLNSKYGWPPDFF